MVQVFFVMLFFPVVMNALQYYIIDSFIKDQKPSEHGHIPSEDEDIDDDDDDDDDDHGHDDDERRFPARLYDGVDGSEIREEATKDGSEVKVYKNQDKPKLKVDPKKVELYNPPFDGEGSGGSGEMDCPKSSLTPASRPYRKVGGAKEPYSPVE